MASILAFSSPRREKRSSRSRQDPRTSTRAHIPQQVQHAGIERDEHGCHAYKPWRSTPPQCDYRRSAVKQLIEDNRAGPAVVAGVAWTLAMQAAAKRRLAPAPRRGTFASSILRIRPLEEASPMSPGLGAPQRIPRSAHIGDDDVQGRHGFAQRQQMSISLAGATNARCRSPEGAAELRRQPTEALWSCSDQEVRARSSDRKPRAARSRPHDCAGSQACGTARRSKSRHDLRQSESTPLDGQSQSHASRYPAQDGEEFVHPPPQPPQRRHRHNPRRRRQLLPPLLQLPPVAATTPLLQLLQRRTSRNLRPGIGEPRPGRGGGLLPGPPKTPGAGGAPSRRRV